MSELSRTYEINEDYVQLLQEKLGSLIAGGNLLDLLMLLAQKIGYEIGQIKRILL